MNLSMFIDCQKLSYLVLQQHHNLLLICDVPQPSRMDFLILHTVNEDQEVHLINQLARSVKAQHTTDIVIYGLHNHGRFLESAMAKRERIRALGFTKVYIYLGGLYLWIANWAILQRDQFPITVSEHLLNDLQTRLPPLRPPEKDDPDEKWDQWMRFLGLRVIQCITV